MTVGLLARGLWVSHLFSTSPDPKCVWKIVLVSIWLGIEFLKLHQPLQFGSESNVRTFDKKNRWIDHTGSGRLGSLPEATWISAWNRDKKHGTFEIPISRHHIWARYLHLICVVYPWKRIFYLWVTLWYTEPPSRYHHNHDKSRVLAGLCIQINFKIGNKTRAVTGLNGFFPPYFSRSTLYRFVLFSFTAATVNRWCCGLNEEKKPRGTPCGEPAQLI